jgi:hypothetical protein
MEKAALTTTDQTTRAESAPAQRPTGHILRSVSEIPREDTPTATQQRPAGDVEMKSLVGENGHGQEEMIATSSGMVVAGAIVDSWVETARTSDAIARLVLQVAPRGHPNALVIVEAEVSLVSDHVWLEDLSENLCHGSPVLAIVSRLSNGWFAAKRLKLAR